MNMMMPIDLSNALSPLHHGRLSNLLFGLLLLSSGLVQASTSAKIDNSNNNGVCSVTPEKATMISNLLVQATQELMTLANYSVKQEVNYRRACLLKLSYVQNQANYIIFQFKLLKQDGSLFATEMKRMRRFLADFNQVIDDMKLSYQQPVSNSADRFDTVLEALKQEVNSLFDQTNRLHGKSRESSIQLCVAHLRNGDAQAAFQEFNKIDDNSVLDRITREAYNHKRNPDNTETILEFSSLLPNCTLDAILYSTLFEEMQKYGNLNKPEVLTVYEATKQCSGPLHKLERLLLPHVESIISKWAEKIQNNVTDQITAFAEKGSLSKSALAHNIPSLVTSSFLNQINNFGSVLNFAAGLSDATLSAAAFSTLLSEMKKVDGLYSYEVVRLAYKLKETMDFGAYDFSEENRLKFEEMKNSLPSLVVGLIWNGANCTAKNMKNVRSLEYLYADSHFHHDNRRAFTWTSTGIPTEGFWAFETGDDGQTFTIKSNYWNEYLFAGDKRDARRNWVLLSNQLAAGNQGHWKIKPVDNFKFSILNTFLEACPYAEQNMGFGHRPNGRGVFTWKVNNQKLETDATCHWVINCQNV